MVERSQKQHVRGLSEMVKYSFSKIKVRFGRMSCFLLSNSDFELLSDVGTTLKIGQF